MNCPTVRDLYLEATCSDERPDISDSGRAHLEACPACSRWVAQLVALDEGLTGMPCLEPSSVRAPGPSESFDSGKVSVKPALRLHPSATGGSVPRRHLLRFALVPTAAAAAAVLAVWASLWLVGGGEQIRRTGRIEAVPPTPAPAPVAAVVQAPPAAGPVAIGPSYIDALAIGSETGVGESLSGELGIADDDLIELPARERARVIDELARRSPERAEIVRHYFKSLSRDHGRHGLTPPEAPPAAGPPSVPLELRIVRVDEARR